MLIGDKGVQNFRERLRNRVRLRGPQSPSAKPLFQVSVWAQSSSGFASANWHMFLSGAAKVEGLPEAETSPLPLFFPANPFPICFRALCTAACSCDTRGQAQAVQ